MCSIGNDPLYENKFTVLNNKHILNSLNGGELHQLGLLLRKINTHDNNYLVVNQDEPYARDVWDIIKKHETKEIVAFIGVAGSGKDYNCAELVKQGFVKMSFADPLRKVCFASLGIPYEEGMEKYDHLKSNDCITVDGYPSFNFRTFLERLGTEGIRQLDNDFWARSLVNSIHAKKVCISDMRFLNEYDCLKKFAEENDYKFKVVFCNYHSDRYQEENKHESAKMSNYFVRAGYRDLTELNEVDFENFRKFIG